MSEKRPFPLSFPNYLLVDAAGDALAFREPGGGTAIVFFTQDDAAAEFLSGFPGGKAVRYDDIGSLLERLRRLDASVVTDTFINPESPQEMGTAVPLQTMINALEE